MQQTEPVMKEAPPPIPPREETPQPMMAPTPPPATQGLHLADVELPFRLYGYLEPRVIVASHAVQSYGQQNMSAITGAANPVLGYKPTDARMSFQVQQSRFGFMTNESKPVRGVLEMDFIDINFQKDTPTVQAQPRLRMAKVEIDALDKKLLIVAGQDWDLYQPVNHHGLNLVGGAFFNGNTGFMRQQVKFIGKLGDFEIGAAVGMPTINATAIDTNTEISRMPSFAARIAYLPNAKSTVGVSGLATSLRLGNATVEHRTFAGAAGVFGDLVLSPMTNIRFEGYIGQNLQNMGSQALGQVNLTSWGVIHNIQEFGGFLSIRQSLGNEMNWIFGYGGIAHIMNDGVMMAGYSRAGGAVTATAGVQGIRQNITAHLGYEFRPYKNLGIMLEGFWLRTHYKLLASDVGNVDGDAKSAGAELGMMYTF